MTTYKTHRSHSPTRLNTIPFAYLQEQQQNKEFDIIAVVVNCRSIKYAGANSNKCREIIVMDTGMNPFILMLWEDFADVDGSTLAAQVAEYPVIVAKRITRTTYGDNRPRLMRYSQQNSSRATLSLVLAPKDNEIVPIANI
ncbi:uncharacterized protein LOC107772882 isoform X3 [Nicotiana tabacum]|uniref:Uncharacterized protein LOC107772882 isoform X3 n=2 Tax=Nicotiana tabacum TaxID=4097 RepID=A0AC58UNJ4_TOBAC